jgi:outer membrane protein assembly factor BamB
MSVNVSAPSDRVAPDSLWTHTALSAAVVSAVFGLVFLVLLAGDFVRSSVASKAYQDKVAAIKRQLQAGGSVDAQVAELRQIDLKARKETLRWAVFSRRCGLFLVISAALALAGAKAAGTLQGPAPRSDASRNSQDQQALQDRYARWSVTGALVVLGLGAVTATLYPTVRIAQAGSAPALPSAEQMSRNWYRFRGPQGAAVSPFTNLPVDWDGPTGKGILWKTPIPLSGHSSPIVWEGRVFVSGADKEHCRIFCLDAATGKILWTGDVPGTVPQGLEVQEDTGLAACTLATDGVRVYAIFATGDLVAFDLAGKRAWHRSLGLPDSAYGYASSLEVFGGRVLVQYDQGQPDQGKSRLLAFDGATGRPAWEKTRPVGGSWTSPIVAKVGQGYQLITAANPWVIAYDPNTGDELWRANLGGGDMAPSPICADGRVIVIEPYSKVVALKTDGRGDVTTSGVAWKSDRGGPDIASPASDGRSVYLLDTDGTLSAVSLADGSPVYQKALDLSFRASPTLAGEALVVLSEKGTFIRLAAGPAFKELGRCEVGEACRASPAFAEGRMFIRGKDHLYCIAAQAK